MEPQSRNCQNCKQDFRIEPEDFNFYQKMGVPAPSWCPECRLIRRMTWRNERSLYRRTCAKTGKDIISIFHPSSNLTVYERDLWWSDDWDAGDFNKEYDFSKPFFKQFRELLSIVPMPALFTARSINCGYCNHIGEMKSSYLSFGSWAAENILYGTRVAFSKDSADILVADNAELTYDTFNSTKTFKVLYSQDVENCNDSYFLFDCKGCTSCFMSSNLRNKSYCFRNVQYSRDEYLKKLGEYDLGKRSVVEELRKEFNAMKLHSLHKFAHLINTKDCTGDNIRDAYNCKECFDIFDKVKDSKWAIHGGFNIQDCYDCYGMGASADLMYESIDVGDSGTHYLGVIVTWVGTNVSYCINCHGCTDCFGCIGLRKKQYCIFNKQYSKEEYEALVSKIISHMKEMPYVDSKGHTYVHGDFFPSELSPFAYNETIAQDYFPLNKEKTESAGYTWREIEKREYVPTITKETLPDSITDISDGIINDVIACEHAGLCTHQCTQAFKITTDELSFYRRLSIPVPVLCSNCRHHRRLDARNPMKLWHRTCMCKLQGHQHSGACSNEFETSYAPNRPEKVYCETCYQQEVV